MSKAIQDQRVLILGNGYTSSFLQSYADQHLQLKFPIQVGSRKHESAIHPFDLTDSGTWKNIPPSDITFWTFPATPIEAVRGFLNLRAHELGRIITIGTTGCFLTSKKDELVTEVSVKDLSMSRVQGEELIRTSGGIIVHAAGIYGPERSPIDWINKGRVSANDKYVNLIHVEDLAHVLWQAAELGMPQSNYIACDEKSFRWKDLFEHWKGRYETPEQSSGPEGKISKYVDASQTRNTLQIKLKYPCVLNGLPS